MSNAMATTGQTSMLAINDEKPFLEIETVSNEYHSLISDSRNDFFKMAITAKAFGAMKSLLTDKIVSGFKHLENSKLGFKTDRKDGYPIDVVRSCLIEAHLNGVRVIGNEFNIIAGQTYITKEGFIGKMQRCDGFKNVRLNIGVPMVNQSESRAIIKCSATWEYHGTQDSLECEIPVRWDKYSSDDALIGKAERKLRARIWNQATGDIMQDGDADHAVEQIPVVCESTASISDQIQLNEPAVNQTDEEPAQSEQVYFDEPAAEEKAQPEEKQLTKKEMRSSIHDLLAMHFDGDTERMDAALQEIVGHKEATIENLPRFDEALLPEILEKVEVFTGEGGAK